MGVVDTSSEGHLADQLRRVLDHVAAALFDAYHQPVEPVDAIPESLPTTVVGVVEFTGDLTGELRLSVPQALLDATCPIGEPGPWLSELANQLVGRWKNALWPSGLTIAMDAATMQLLGDATSPSRTYASAHGDAQTWLRYVAAPGLTWHDPTETQRFRVAFEGDVLLF